MIFNYIFLRTSVTQGGSLMINNLDLSDSGVYQCFASNAAGETKISASIKVDSKFEDLAKCNILAFMHTKYIALLYRFTIDIIIV